MFLYDYILPQGKSTDSYSMSGMEYLWTALSAEPDFTKLQTIEILENQLKRRNNLYTRKLFGLEKCWNCEKLLQSPVLQRCSDQICGDCFETLKSSNTDTCRACGDHFLVDDGTAEESIQQRHREYSNFQSSLNKFYLEVLSSLCFDGHLPEQKLVRHLIEVIVYRKRQDGGRHVLHGCIDPTPVLRSFVLQQLLACSHEQDGMILDMLSNAYLNVPENFKCADSDKIQLMLLILFCMEDSQTSAYFDKATNELAKDIMENRQMTIRVRQAQYAAEGIQHRLDDNSDINVLRTVALTRLVLSTAADAFVQSHQVEEIYSTTKDLCTSKNEKLYLLRCVIKKYGFGALRELTSNALFSWILPDGIEMQEDNRDFFLSRGWAYFGVRNALQNALLNQENLEDLVSIFKEGSKKETALDFVLSVYRLITTDFRIKPPPQQTIEALQWVLEELKTHIDDQNIWDSINQLSSNTQPTPPLSPDKDAKDYILQDILVHCWQLLKILPLGGQFELLRPFIMLTTEPDKMQECFLPTMPGDPVSEFLQARQSTDLPDAKMYACPNGHPYEIGNCTKPWEKGVCPVCNSVIGGTLHQLAAGNSVFDVSQDRTRKGHVLGEDSLEFPEPERNLTPLSLRVTRLILHTTMFIGSRYHLQMVASMIHPKPSNVEDFLWRHMRSDLAALIKLTNRSCDDVAILIHSIINGFCKAQHTNADCTLSSKLSRENWETEFMNTYISPITQSMDRVIADANKAISRDKNMANGALLGLLNSADKILEVPEDIRQCPTLWCYRTAPDLMSLQYELTEQNTGATCESDLLKTFLCLHPILQHMHLLPSVIKLLLTLRTMYRGRLSLSEATRLTVKDFIDKAADEKQVREQLGNLRILLRKLNQHIVERCADLDNIEWELNADTPLCDILPEISGSGKRVWVLLEVLVDAHNRMLQAFCDSNNVKFDGLVELSLCDLAPSHLIEYNTDEKLLPLIRAHARYELQQGKRMQQSFEITSLAQHLKSWLFVARPRIKTRPLIEPIATTKPTSSTLLKLNITQVKLDPGEARIIFEQCKNLSDVTASLRTLDTALGFLTVVHRDPTQLLSTFLRDDIKINMEFVSSEAMRVCELQHVRDLWFILALRKAEMLTTKQQDGLEWLPQEDRVRIDDEELLEKTRVVLKRCGRDLLLPLLLRCVVFHTSQDELNYPLRDMLEVVADEQDMSPPGALPELPGVPEKQKQEDEHKYLRTNQIADVFREAVQLCKARNRP